MTSSKDTTGDVAVVPTSATGPLTANATEIRPLRPVIELAARVETHSAPTSVEVPAVGFTAAAATVLSGRYRLDEHLGEGGMGVVFRATDLRMPGVSVAVKLLKSEFRESADLLNILRESVRKVRALPHPNIASVYSLESDGKNDYVVMELLQGKTLQALLDGEYARGVPLVMARTLIADMCNALAYAHDHGVIHSDIKPSNIFVTPSGRAKLFDFDIARVLRGPVGYFDARQLRAVTRAYATTEMMHGDQPDQRDDVYALACVIYETLSGKHPFNGASVSEASERGLQMKPLPTLKPRENRALSQALKFNREERLASVEALRAAFAGRGTQRSTAWLRPLAWGGGAIAVLLIAGLTWWFIKSATTARQQELTARATTELDRAKTLAFRATELAVDGRNETLRRALMLLHALPTADPEHTFKQAQEASTALLAALEHAPRIAHLGTTEAQIEQALQLCRGLKIANQQCSPRDLADEALRSVSLQPFALDPTPVTNREFASFAQATGYRMAAETAGVLYALDPARIVYQGIVYEVLRHQNWRTLREAATKRGEMAEALPVLGTDLESARAYCKWKQQRLPSEDEWEYSARGPSGKIFPWGDQSELPSSLATQVSPVPERGTSKNAGSQLLFNNVAEWAESRVAGQRVLRGGSWLLHQPYFQRLALRRNAPTGAVMDAGFRCASSLDKWADAD